MRSVFPQHLTLRIWGCLSPFPCPPSDKPVADLATKVACLLIRWRIEAQEQPGHPRAVLESVSLANLPFALFLAAAQILLLSRSRTALRMRALIVRSLTSASVSSSDMCPPAAALSTPPLHLASHPLDLRLS